MAEISRRTLFNRSLLAGAAVIGAGLGVTKSIHHKVSVPPPPPPAALTDARAANALLLAQYDADLEAYARSGAARGNAALVDRLSALRADVAAHGQLLDALLERYPGWRLAQSRPAASSSPTPTSTPGSASTQDLAAVTGATMQAYTSACLNWPGSEPNAGEVIAALGSMSACLATHRAMLT